MFCGRSLFVGGGRLCVCTTSKTAFQASTRKPRRRKDGKQARNGRFSFVCCILSPFACNVSEYNEKQRHSRYLRNKGRICQKSGNITRFQNRRALINSCVCGLRESRPLSKSRPALLSEYGQNETARRPLIWFLVVVEAFAAWCIQPRRLYSLNTAAVCYTQRGGRCSLLRRSPWSAPAAKPQHGRPLPPLLPPGALVESKGAVLLLLSPNCTQRQTRVCPLPLFTMNGRPS